MTKFPRLQVGGGDFGLLCIPSYPRVKGLGRVSHEGCQLPVPTRSGTRTSGPYAVGYMVLTNSGDIDGAYSAGGSFRVSGHLDSLSGVLGRQGIFSRPRRGVFFRGF